MRQPLRRLQAADELERKGVQQDELYEQEIKVVKPQFDLETYPRAKLRDGANELTLRADGEGPVFTFFGAKEINSDRWSQVLYQSIETEEWYKMYETQKELHRELQQDEGLVEAGRRRQESWRGMVR